MHDVIASDIGGRAIPSSGQTSRPTVTVKSSSPFTSPCNVENLALVSAGLLKRNIYSYQKGD